MSSLELSVGESGQEYVPTPYEAARNQLAEVRIKANLAVLDGHGDLVDFETIRELERQVSELAESSIDVLSRMDNPDQLH
ncbi:MAG TPA: hypothetical protein VFP35_03840 [Candidatus Saccharimonadales bacterium]|nr:hypothetical protein [Candidatus Saccharimonadales bacterium]